MSCRDQSSHDWTSWDWLGTVEIKDQFGHAIRPNPDKWHLNWGKRSVWGNSSNGRGGSRDILQEEESQTPLADRNQYRFLSLHIARPDLPVLQALSVIGKDGSLLGQLKPAVSLPPPDPKIEISNIHFQVSMGDWKARIEELDFRRESGLYDESFTEFSQVREAASVTVGYEFQGRFVTDEQVASGTQWLEDRMGNLFDLGYFRPALPTGSAVWKFVTHVARNNDAHFETSELQPLGDFRIRDEVIFHKTSNKGGPTGLILIPKGDRNLVLEFPGFEFPVKDFQPEVGTWAMGESLELGYVQPTGRPSSYSGGTAGWTAKEGVGTRFSTDTFGDEDVDEIRLKSEFTSSSPFRKIGIEADLPLVILATTSDFDKAVHHLIATDKAGKQLSVRPCYHIVQNQPVFAIDVSEDTEFSLFYCQEPLQRLEFIIPAPHTAFESLNPESSDLKATLVPEGNAWRNLMPEPSDNQ